jgi:uroporphyrinogen decarboxylase
MQPTIVQNDVRSSEHDLLLRVARGEKGERTPVWLMRQAGRYMKAFKEYSDKYPFRVRSETPDIAIELSLQPFKAFGTDGVIMFSDILTPLPSMGIEFDVVKGSGPIIFDPIRSAEQVSKLKKIDDPDKTAPFLRTILSSLRKVHAHKVLLDPYAIKTLPHPPRQETEGKTTLLGFVGSPFTLAAYAIEGKANKNCYQARSPPPPQSNQPTDPPAPPHRRPRR